MPFLGAIPAIAAGVSALSGAVGTGLSIANFVDKKNQPAAAASPQAPPAPAAPPAVPQLSAPTPAPAAALPSSAPAQASTGGLQPMTLGGPFGSPFEDKNRFGGG